MSLKTGHATLRRAAVLVVATGIAMSSGCALPSGLPPPATPQQLVGAPVTVRSGQAKSVPVRASLSSTGILKIALGDVRLIPARDASSCCSTTPVLAVRANGFYRKPPSNGDSTEMEGDAEWNYCIEPNSTIQVPLGQEFFELSGGLTIDLNAAPGSYAELRTVAVEP